MEDKIKGILIKKFKNYLEGMHIGAYNEDIINVINFYPFEINFDDLNNVIGTNVGFTCYVKGRIKGIVKAKKTYSFNFSGVATVIKANELIDLDMSNLDIPFYNHEG